LRPGPRGQLDHAGNSMQALRGVQPDFGVRPQASGGTIRSLRDPLTAQSGIRRKRVAKRLPNWFKERPMRDRKGIRRCDEVA
jgi:hypothetical protein